MPIGVNGDCAEPMPSAGDGERHPHDEEDEDAQRRSAQCDTESP